MFCKFPRQAQFKESSLSVKCVTLLGLMALFLTEAAATRILCLTNRGNEWIDTETHICCNGPIDKFLNGVEQKCCREGTNSAKTQAAPYNPQQKICCEGVLSDLRRNNQNGTICCGKDVLYEDTSLCCNSKIYQKSKNPEDDLYIMCLKNGDEEIPLRRTERICEKIVDGKIQRNVVKSEEYYECCGLELYDTRNKTHKCVEDSMWPWDARVSHCGSTIYDRNAKACCDNNYLIPIEKSPDAQVKYLGIQQDFECVDGKQVDKDFEQIAFYDNKKFVIPKHYTPCGNTSYDPDNSRTQVQCCDGVVNHADPSLNVSCCGKEFIDTSQYVCCNNKKIPTTSDKECCNGRTFSRSEGLECCGGIELINNSYICCRPQSSYYKAVRRQQGHNYCCGTETYNSAEMTCCAGTLKKLKSNQVCDNHTGEVIDTNLYTRRQVGKIKQYLEDQLPGRNNMFRNRKTDCLSCAQLKKQPEDCVKKFGFRVYVKNVTKMGGSTRLDALIFDPLMDMTFRTNADCQCFKEDQLYMFYTNRNLVQAMNTKVKKSRKLVMRFSSKDIFRPIEGKYPKYSVKKCKIDRYLKKPSTPKR